MSVTLQRVEGVPILRTGTYALASGPFTFTEEHLAAAVAAVQDPGIVAPRIKLGHIDPRDGFDGGELLDGQPALGWAEDLTLTENGHTVTATLVVPDWLASSMEFAYPARSVEGIPGFESGTGRHHDLVITAVSLLGESLPGILTLDDLRELLSEAGPVDEEPVPIAASLRAEPAANLTAGIATDLIRERFVGQIDDGTITLPDGVSLWAMWPRSIRLEDDGSVVLIASDDESGRLYRVPVTVAGSDVTFGDLTEVIETYVAASAAPRSRPPVAVWASRADARPNTNQEDDSPMTDEQRRALARALGQPEDTTEERLHEIAAETPAPEPTPEPDPAPEPEGEPQPEPEAVAASAERTVSVSREVWEETQRQAREGAQAREDQIRASRDALVRAAVDDGRITPAEAGLTRQSDGSLPEGWRADLDAAPEVTERRLAKLEAGRYPGNSREKGHNAQADDGTDTGYARVAASFGGAIRPRQEA